jgi:hypothetical protein
MPPQKSKGRTGLRSLEDNALLLLVFAISLAFAWIRRAALGGRAGNRVHAAA